MFASKGWLANLVSSDNGSNMKHLSEITLLFSLPTANSLNPLLSWAKSDHQSAVLPEPHGSWASLSPPSMTSRLSRERCTLHDFVHPVVWWNVCGVLMFMRDCVGLGLQDHKNKSICPCTLLIMQEIPKFGYVCMQYTAYRLYVCNITSFMKNVGLCSRVSVHEN